MVGLGQALCYVHASSCRFEYSVVMISRVNIEVVV
jgi:hypothetical protein